MKLELITAQILELIATWNDIPIWIGILNGLKIVYTYINKILEIFQLPT